jgi:hypothetical protein
MFILASLGVIITNSDKPVFSTGATWGLLGFLDSERFFEMIVLQGFLCGLCAGFGQIFCMFFYAPVLTQSVLLAVPFLAEGFAFAANVDKPLDFISFFV